MVDTISNSGERKKKIPSVQISSKFPEDMNEFKRTIKKRNIRRIPKFQRQSSPSTFRGASVAMNGNVFQLQSERIKKIQLMTTVEALKVLSSIEFKRDIAYLQILFKDQRDVKVPLPVKPKCKEVTDDSGNNMMIHPTDIEMKFTR